MSEPCISQNLCYIPCVFGSRRISEETSTDGKLAATGFPFSYQSLVWDGRHEQREKKAPEKTSARSKRQSIWTSRRQNTILRH